MTGAVVEIDKQVGIGGRHDTQHGLGVGRHLIVKIKNIASRHQLDRVDDGQRPVEMQILAADISA